MNVISMLSDFFLGNCQTRPGSLLERDGRCAANKHNNEELDYIFRTRQIYLLDNTWENTVTNTNK